jgi:hypothetical protein
MPNPDGVSREDAFLQVYRAIRKVIDGATFLAEQLESDPEAHYAFSAERADVGYGCLDSNWDHVWPAVDALGDAIQQDLIQEAIQQERIQALDNETIGGTLGEIQCVFSHAEEFLPLPGQRGGDPRGLAEVVDRLEMAVATLEDLCDRQAIAVFGPWGGHWFTIAAKGKFSLNDFDNDNWPKAELSAKELLAAMDKPPDDATKQELEDPDDATEQESEGPIELRNAWIYKQVMDGIRYPEIIKELKSKPMDWKWQPISNAPGISGAAKGYAKRHDLQPPERRKPGRPAGR